MSPINLEQVLLLCRWFSNTQAAAKVAALKNAKPGQWVTYKTYPHERNQAALVAANDLRKKRIAAVRDSGLDISRVKSF